MTTEVLPRFKCGDRVRVRSAFVPGHMRTPGYIQGKAGWIQAVYGPYRNPESLGHGGDGLPKQPLYRVGFLQREVWDDRYTGPPTDTVYVDLYDHWLEPA